MIKTSQAAGFKSFLTTPYRSRSTLEAYRNRQLCRLVKHAFMKVPYYRKMCQAHGLTHRDIQSVDDLWKIPVTSKKDLQQARPDEIVAQDVDPKKLIVRKTSGSTGEPSTIRRTWFEERLLQAFRHRAMFSFGQTLTDQNFFVGRIRPVHPRDRQILIRAANSLGMLRTNRADCLLPCAEIIAIYEQHAVDILRGLTGSLFQIASELIHKDCRVHSPRFIVTGGEQLTPFMRRQIQVAFQAPVFDTYGSHEFNLLAWECKETGQYHVCDDLILFEVLKDGRRVEPGEQGEVVVTNLLSKAMPFLRYRLGDVVTQGFSQCPCGAPFSTIEEIQGRMIDYLLVEDGKKSLHPYEIIRHLVHDQKPWISQYQIVQESLSRIVLKAVPLCAVESEKLQQIEEKVSTVLGKQTEFSIQLVSHIPREPSGKYVVCRSLLKSMYET